MAHWMSAIRQNQPAIIEIKGFKTSHFKESTTAPLNREAMVSMGMSNVLKVSLQTTIYSLAQRGWSQRRIAKELGINRETVGRYLRLSKPAISTTGFEDGQSPKPAISITGNLAGKRESKPAISIAGIGAGRRSRCEVFAEAIAAKVEAAFKRVSQIICGEEDRLSPEEYQAYLDKIELSIDLRCSESCFSMTRTRFQMKSRPISAIDAQLEYSISSSGRMGPSFH
jgi:hypothetical protein